MRADPSTWATLQTSLGNWLDQDFSASQLQEFIALAERHLNRHVFTPDREASFTVTADARSAALPTDFWGFKTAPYVDGTADNVLTRVTPDQLRAIYPTDASGTPAHFAIQGESILFGPVPTSSEIKGSYYSVIPALDGTTDTNWLLTDHPDLYLAAALAEGFLFNMDEQRAGYWAAKRDEKIESVNKAGRRRSVDSGPLTATSSVSSVSNIQA